MCVCFILWFRSDSIQESESFVLESDLGKLDEVKPNTDFYRVIISFSTMSDVGVMLECLSHGLL